MSRSTSWCWRARVAVATTTRRLVEQARHEVAERLAGAGAGLHEQVAARLHRVGDGLGHRHLALALLTAEGARPPSRAPRGRACPRTGGWGRVGHPSTLAADADSPVPPPTATISPTSGRHFSHLGSPFLPPRRSVVGRTRDSVSTWKTGEPEEQEDSTLVWRSVEVFSNSTSTCSGPLLLDLVAVAVVGKALTRRIVAPVHSTLTEPAAPSQMPRDGGRAVGGRVAGLRAARPAGAWRPPASRRGSAEPEVAWPSPVGWSPGPSSPEPWLPVVPVVVVAAVGPSWPRVVRGAAGPPSGWPRRAAGSSLGAAAASGD